MSAWSLTYQQSVFKRYRSDKHFSAFLPTRRRQKSTGVDTESNYVIVTLCRPLLGHYVPWIMWITYTVRQKKGTDFLLRASFFILENRNWWIFFHIQGGPKKRGHILMTIILSNLNRFKMFSLEDSLVNLQLNGYQKSRFILHLLLHYLVKN